MITVEKVRTDSQKEEIFAIREQVFVLEQNVPKDEEYDEYEDTSTHYIAYYDHKPIGTARWRFTEKGIKLERFAVLAPYRDKKVGRAILEKILVEIIPYQADKELYLHAQVQAVGFYEKFGFQKVGDTFQECDIWHYTMKMK